MRSTARTTLCRSSHFGTVAQFCCALWLALCSDRAFCVGDSVSRSQIVRIISPAIYSARHASHQSREIARGQFLAQTPAQWMSIRKLAVAAGQNVHQFGYEHELGWVTDRDAADPREIWRSQE